MPESIRAENVTKRFGAVSALTDVSIEFLPGETHVLAGENGAGKSTLMRILCGAVTDYEGRILIGDMPVRFASPHAAAVAGVAIVHQELSLIPDMSVADNLLLGVEPNVAGFRRRRTGRDEAQRLLKELGLEVDPEQTIRELPISLCQLLEVAKSLRTKPKLLILDEPTSALNAKDAEKLFAIIAGLKSQGVAIAYITHRMEEIRGLADRISVLRDGRFIGTYLAGEITDEGLIGKMIGDAEAPTPRALSETRTTPRDGAQTLLVRNLTVEDRGRTVVREAGFEVRAGEVVGLAGLQGSGASELMAAIFGARGRIAKGEIDLGGETFRPRSPGDSIRRGLALVPNDRKEQGLVLPLTVAENATLVSLPAISSGGWRRPRAEANAANRVIDDFRIRTPSPETPVSALSGGNQQKVVLGKWTLDKPKLLLLDEPTRGIDIAAKREIYALIEKWKAEGLAILLITSELPELLALSDRILTMHRGKIVREFAKGEATAENVLQAAMQEAAA